MTKNSTNCIDFEKNRLDVNLQGLYARTVEEMSMAEAAEIMRLCEKTRELIENVGLDDFEAIAQKRPNHKLRQVGQALLENPISNKHPKIIAEIFTMIGEFMINVQICLLKELKKIKPRPSGESVMVYNGTMRQIFAEHEQSTDEKISLREVRDLAELPDELLLKLRYFPFIQISLAYRLARTGDVSNIRVHTTEVEARMDSPLEQEAAIQGLKMLLPKVPEHQIYAHFFHSSKPARELYEDRYGRNWLDTLQGHTLDSQAVEELVVKLH